MRNRKRIGILAALALALAAVLAVPAPALADDSNVTNVTSADGNISVSVPTEVPMYVDAAGYVTTASDTALEITNNSDSSAVFISDVDVAVSPVHKDFNLTVKSGLNGSSLADWFSYKKGAFIKPRFETKLAARASLSTSWSLDKLDAKANSALLADAANGGATLATVTYTFKEPDPVDFAVFSADDSTLRLYRRPSVPKVGDTFDGHVVTYVFADIDNQKNPFSRVSYRVSTVDIVDKGICPNTCCEWFYGMSSLASFNNASNLDTSNVKNMDFMFKGCSKLSVLDLSKWDTSNVTSIEYMFQFCSGLTSLDVSKWNTSSVTDMSSMFASCNKLTELDVSDWDISKVENMGNMFKECKTLVELDVSRWNTSMATNMSGMFNKCYALGSIDVSSWDTSRATNMSSMFSEYGALESIAVSGWDTSNATDMSSMFSYCRKLTKLEISDWNTSNATNMSGMFSNCNTLSSLDVSNWDTSKVTNMHALFLNCNALSSFDVSKWNTFSVANMEYMFSGCSGLSSLDLSNFNTSKVTDMSYMFTGCSGLSSLDLSNFNTSNVENMSFIFNSCGKLASLDLSGWDTTSVSSYGYMFPRGNALNKISIGDSWTLGRFPGLSGTWYDENGVGHDVASDITSAGTYYKTNPVNAAEGQQACGAIDTDQKIVSVDVNDGVISDAAEDSQFVASVDVSLDSILRPQYDDFQNTESSDSEIPEEGQRPPSLDGYAQTESTRTDELPLAA